MMKNKDTLNEHIKMLASLQGKHKLLYLLELSKAAPVYPPEHRDEHTLIQGCASVSYLHTFIQNNKVHTHIDSESQFVKGMLYVLHLYLKTLTPLELKDLPTSTILENIGLTQHITMQRTIGFSFAVQKAKKYIFMV